MSPGDLVRHKPENSVVENILRKLSFEDLRSDFKIGIVIDAKTGRSLVFANENSGLCWYDNSELLNIV